MVEITIRPARNADVDELIQLDTTMEREPGRADHIRQWVQAGEGHVAESGGRLVGYGVVNARFFRQGQVELLMIHPDFRRQGMGRKLLRHLADLCPTEKCWVTTNLSNQPMQRLLAGEGFALSGFIENLDKGDPELVFVKRMTQGAN